MQKIFCLVLGLAPSGLLALPNDVSTSWLKIPTSARSAAMGGAFIAVGDDLESLGANAAGLAEIQTPQACLMQSFWAQDLSFQHLAYGQPAGPESGYALGVDYMNFGQVDKTILSNGSLVSDGTYSPMAMNFYGGYAQALARGLNAGASVKVLYQNITTVSSATVAVDAGFLYRLPGNGLSLALVFTNLGGTLDTASLPLQMTLGAAYRLDLDRGKGRTARTPEIPQHRITLSTDGNISLHDTGFSNYRIGAEYWYRQQWALRAGYRFAPYGDLSGVSGLSAGIGFRFNKTWELSYALTTQGDMGSTHQISLKTSL